MLVGIITLVLAITLSYVLVGGIILALSLNKKFVKWYGKKVIDLLGDVVEGLEDKAAEVLAKQVDSIEEKDE